MCGRQGKWKLKPKDMDIDVLKAIVEEVRVTSPKTFMQIVGNGEPFLHPKIREMLKVPINAGLSTIITTNASQPLTDLPKLSYLAVSIDACSEQLYEEIRVGGHWNQLMMNLNHFRFDNPTMPLQFNSVFMMCNMEDLKQMPQLLRKFRVNRWFIQSVKPLNSWAREQVVPQYLCSEWFYCCKKTLASIGKWCNSVLHNIYHPGTCIMSGQYMKYGMPGSPYIDVEGYVMPCCTIADPKLSFGNIFKDGSLKKIWFGEKAVAWRKQMLSRNPPAICREICEYII